MTCLIAHFISNDEGGMLRNKINTFFFFSSPILKFFSNTIGAGPRRPRQHVGMARGRTRRARQLVSCGHCVSVPGWAVSSALGVRSRTSTRISELEILCAPASCMFSVIAVLMSSGNMRIQPNFVESEVKFVLTPVLWR